MLVIDGKIYLLKIMQINVWQGRLLEPLLTFIREEAPDVIFAQEIYSYPELVDPRSPWSCFNTLELIAEQNQLNHTYFSPASIFPMFGRHLSYGNAILSKFDFEHTSTHYTNGSEPLQIDQPHYFDGNTVRSFQHAVIRTGNTKLNLINHHGHWVKHPHGDGVSANSLLKIAGYIKQLDAPIIAGGDLNVAPDSFAVVAFKKVVNLRDLVGGTDAVTTLSQAHRVQNVISDYILTSPDLDIHRVEVSDKLISDHKAVIAEINC